MLARRALRSGRRARVFGNELRIRDTRPAKASKRGRRHNRLPCLTRCRVPEHHARRERSLSIRRFAVTVLVAVPIATLLAACGDSACPMRAIDRCDFEGSVSTFAFHDVVIAPHSNLEVDLASAAITGQAARADAFLAPADCTQLFDGAYPGERAALPGADGPGGPRNGQRPPQAERRGPPRVRLRLSPASAPRLSPGFRSIPHPWL